MIAGCTGQQQHNQKQTMPQFKHNMILLHYEPNLLPSMPATSPLEVAGSASEREKGDPVC